MAESDELLETEDEETTYLTIDWDTREITIPSTILNIGVEHDKDSNRLYFKCPATYGEFDVSIYNIRVCFGNYDTTKKEVSADIYGVTDAVSEDGYITFSWLVGANAYSTKGTVYFTICCVYTDDEGNIVSDLNTTLANLPVLEGRDCNTEDAIVENYYDLYTKLVSLVDNASIYAENAETSANAAENSASDTSALFDSIEAFTEDEITAAFAEAETAA